MNLSPMLKRIIIIATAFFIATLIPPSHASEREAATTSTATYSELGYQYSPAECETVECVPAEKNKPA